MKKHLYKFTNKQYRNTVISAVICTKEEIEKISGNTIYVSDMFGKHAHAEFDISEKDFELISDDSDFIEKVLSTGLYDCTRFNPFDHFEEAEENDIEESLNNVTETKPETQTIEFVYKESLTYLYEIDKEVKEKLKNNCTPISKLYEISQLAKKYGLLLNKKGTLARHVKSADMILQLIEEKEIIENTKQH